MIKILIIEDEIPARKKLRRFIEEIDSETEIVNEIDSVHTAIAFLKQENVDLIFSDIELLNGNAFEIFNQVTIVCPIIFTTAYDNFWMNAFETNGIEYLLKPFSKERFKKAWDKFTILNTANSTDQSLLTNLSKLIEQTITPKLYKKRFTIHTYQKIYFLETANITYFEANEGVIFAFDKMGGKHLLSESTLKELEELLNPDDFFRINRSELIGKEHIEKIEHYTKNALAIKIKGYENFLKTSQSNTAGFRQWIEK